MAQMSLTASYGNGFLTILCSITGMAAGYSGSRRIEYTIDGETYTYPFSTSGTSVSLAESVPLAPGETCYYYYELQYKSDGETEWSTALSKSDSYTAELKVLLWDWNQSNGDATAGQTRRAHIAIDYNGNCSDFSYVVWNDLCYKAKEVIEADGYSWRTHAGLSFNGVTMSEWDKTLTAARFNALLYNINIHYDTGLTEVKTGAKVYGSYFTTITDTLNAWIEEM